MIDKITIKDTGGYLMFGEEVEGMRYSCIPIKVRSKYILGPIYGIF